MAPPEDRDLFDWFQARAVIDHVFRTRHVDELRADADPRNDASIRLLQEMGFVETGREERALCIDREWVDSVYFSLRTAQYFFRPSPSAAILTAAQQSCRPTTGSFADVEAALLL